MLFGFFHAEKNRFFFTFACSMNTAEILRLMCTSKCNNTKFLLLLALKTGS